MPLSPTKGKGRKREERDERRRKENISFGKVEREREGRKADKKIIFFREFSFVIFLGIASFSVFLPLSCCLFRLITRNHSVVCSQGLSPPFSFSFLFYVPSLLPTTFHFPSSLPPTLLLCINTLFSFFFSSFCRGKANERTGEHGTVGRMSNWHVRSMGSERRKLLY